MFTKFKDQEIKTKQVYLNIIFPEYVKTDTLSVSAAKEQYGDLKVLEINAPENSEITDEQVEIEGTTNVFLKG